MRSITLASILASAALSGCAGCGDDKSPVADAYVMPDRPPPDADYGAVPRVEPEPCRFDIGGSLNLVEGTDYACGDLVVKENRDAHVGRIRLHYIRIKSTATTNRGTIYLDGGPGGDGQGILDYAGYLGKPFLDGLLVDGDFLVIGQRGTAKSLPFLECTPQNCDLDNVDLAAYNTAYNADDVDDLRATLGLDALNLYGISYGSRLGLEVIRRHGDKVRAAVIEGLVPSSIVWTAAIPTSFYGALTALNTSCIAAGQCGTQFGDLVTKFTSAVNTLDVDPVMIPTSLGDQPLDGVSFAYVFFRMLYSKSYHQYLPLMINDMAIRRTDRVGTIIGAYIDADRADDVSRGLYYSVVCGELYNPPDPNAFDAANTDTPQEYLDLFGGSYFGLEDTCQDWPKHGLGTQLKMPVTSSVRTFVSSGRLDPITPPSFGTVAATTLSDSFHVIHENSGHGATLQSACGTQNLHAFLANPTATLDTSCAANITTSYLTPNTFTQPVIDQRQLRAELAVTPRIPLPTKRSR